jgi:TPR repeat protein
MRFLISISLLSILLVANSLDELKTRAKSGDINALMKLAFMYENGEGVKQDLSLAKRYYSQAKELGSEDAKISLSLMELSNSSSEIKYLSNNVEIKNVTTLNYTIDTKELKELINRAKNSDKDALFTLATLYDNGYGKLKSDSKKALLLYKKAAKLGSKRAKDVLSLKGIK